MASRCSLTPRSSRAPTAGRAGHQALGLRPILRLLSSAPHRWCRLSSNVRPRMPPLQHSKRVEDLVQIVATSRWFMPALRTVRSLKLSANGMSRWPSSAGAPPPFCACCPACHAVVASLARTLGVTKAMLTTASFQVLLLMVLHSALARFGHFCGVAVGPAFSLVLSPRKGALHSIQHLCRVVGVRPVAAPPPACFVNTATPNPSFKPSPNSVPRRPASAGPAAHLALAGQRGTLSVPA